MQINFAWTDRYDEPTGETRDDFFGGPSAMTATKAIDRTGILTDEHPACSYGQSVLVVDGVPHGPREVVDARVGDQAGAIVNSLRESLVGDEAAMALRFVLAQS